MGANPSFKRSPFLRVYTYCALRRSPNKLAKSLQTYRKYKQNKRLQEVGKIDPCGWCPMWQGMTLGHKVKVGVIEAQ